MHASSKAGIAYVTHGTSTPMPHEATSGRIMVACIWHMRIRHTMRDRATLGHAKA